MQASILGAMLPAAKWVPSASSAAPPRPSSGPPTLVGLAPIERDLRDGGADHEEVGLELVASSAPRSPCR